MSHKHQIGECGCERREREKGGGGVVNWCLRGKERDRQTDRAHTHICGLAVVVELLQVSRQAEVGDLEHVLLGNQHVSGGQVTVNALQQTSLGECTATQVTVNALQQRSR